MVNQELEQMFKRGVHPLLIKKLAKELGVNEKDLEDSRLHSLSLLELVGELERLIGCELNSLTRCTKSDLLKLVLHKKKPQ